MATQPVLERPLPQNLDAERSVLGAILVDNHAINAAIEKLRPEDFFHDHHRRIFQQMMALHESQQAIDLVTLTEELHRHGELEASGGASYLAQLLDGVPHISNIEHYARIVKEKAILRNLIHTTHKIQQRALDAEEDADTILDGAESSIFELAEDRARAGLIGIKDLVRDSFERLEKIRATLAKRTATEREAAQKQAEALAAVALRFTRKAGESDQLFGSVTSADIAEGLAKQGFQLDKRQIQLAEPIKVVGEYQVTAKVYQEITGLFKVVVEKEA